MENLKEERRAIAGEALTAAGELMGAVPMDGHGWYPNFPPNALATTPRPLNRGWLGVLGQIIVLTGTVAVVTGRNGFQRVYPPGTHTLLGVPLGPATIQFVNTARQHRVLPSVCGLSQDKWQVSLVVSVEFQVDDPIAITMSRAPLETLEHAATTAALAQIESMSHDALAGLLEEEPSGLGAVSAGIARRLNNDATTHGLNILGVSILSRQGDDRRVAIMQEAAVEIARQEESLQVHKSGHQNRLANLRTEQAELKAEVEAALEREKLRLLVAEIDADIEQVRRAAQEWQAEKQRQTEAWHASREMELLHMKSQHEQTLEIIRSTAEIAVEAAKKGNIDLAPGATLRRRPEISVTENDGADAVLDALALLRTLQERGIPAAEIREAISSAHESDTSQESLTSVEEEREKEASAG